MEGHLCHITRKCTFITLGMCKCLHSPNKAFFFQKVLLYIVGTLISPWKYRPVYVVGTHLKCLNIFPISPWKHMLWVLIRNIHCGYSLEAPLKSIYTQHVFMEKWEKCKKNIFLIPCHIQRYESDQSIMPLWRILGCFNGKTWRAFRRLVRLYECAGWSESLSDTHVVRHTFSPYAYLIHERRDSFSQRVYFSYFSRKAYIVGTH